MTRVSFPTVTFLSEVVSIKLVAKLGYPAWLVRRGSWSAVSFLAEDCASSRVDICFVVMVRPEIREIKSCAAQKHMIGVR